MLKFILTIALALLVAYLIGLTVVNVVDKRLSEIRINVPQQNVVVEGFSDWVKENYTDWSPKGRKDGEGDIEYRVRGYQPGDKYTPLERQVYAKDLWNAGRPVACFKNHDHKSRFNGNCTYGPCNFMDPRKMSEIDRSFFMRNYRPINMTLQDYVNWLWLYSGGNEEKLPYEHLKNLIKLQKGEKLIYEIGVLPPPADCMPTMNAEDQFYCMYGNLETKGPMASTENFIKGYNVDEY